MSISHNTLKKYFRRNVRNSPPHHSSLTYIYMQSRLAAAIWMRGVNVPQVTSAAASVSYLLLQPCFQYKLVTTVNTGSAKSCVLPSSVASLLSLTSSLRRRRARWSTVGKFGPFLVALHFITFGLMLCATDTASAIS